VIFAVISIRRSYWLDPKNKVIVISGCDSGFGKLSVRQLSRKGCTILAGCYTKEGIQSLNSEKPSNVFPFHLDITKQESIDNATQIIKQHCQDKSLWALINNAGIAKAGIIDLSTMAAFRDTFEVNFFGHVAMTKALLPLLRKSKGRVINTASIMGRGVSFSGGAPYVASKRAIEAFNDCLRLELRPWGITVIVIEPGFMNTPIVTGSKQAQSEMMKNLTREQLLDYGDEYFKETEKAFDSLTKVTGNPQHVADAYVHAALSLYPKHRYLVGYDAWIIFSWLPLLPSWLQDLIVNLVPQPVPAVLKKK